jgi:GNAT superfamily N-acetyltransferase
VKIEFRPARSDDAPAISALLARFSPDVVVNADGSGAEEYLEAVSASAEAGYIADPRYTFLVACPGSELAGVIALRDHSHLFHLFVAPEHQRCGIATRLWELARAAAPGKIAVFTVNSTLSALPVYERFGFVRTGPVTEAHGIRFVPMRLKRVSPATEPPAPRAGE